MSISSPVDRLPEELLLLVLGYLDSEPPSIRKFREEPSLQLTSSDHHDFKHVSCVCRRWRRIALPLLFQFSRIRLEKTADGGACCEALTEEQQSPATISDNKSHPETGDAFGWSRSLNDSKEDFLRFVRKHDLNVTSMAVSMKTPDPIDQASPPVPRDYRNPAVTDFWRALIRETAVGRIVIVAPPADLACLTHCTIDLRGDWAFVDMEYHILELRDDAQLVEDKVRATDTPYISHERRRLEPPSVVIGDNSLFRLPWSHIGLNEGSFLKAYSTYEYFERGPPSVIHSIMQCFSPWHTHVAMCSSLRSFSYTAILPFAHHLDFRIIIPHLDELDIQLAPDPSSNILNDRSRVGRAQMDDCWQELRTAYSSITRSFHTFTISAAGTPKLKKFTCRDFHVPGLAEDLDEAFTPLCLPCWCEDPQGVFSRMAPMPDIQHYDHSSE